MTLFFADLVREACWAVGSGDLALGGALPGHRRFGDVVPAEARFPYVILSLSHPGEWEAGEGEIGSGDTLVRLPSASSNGGAAVVFAAGLKTVALATHASWLAELDDTFAGKAATSHDHDGDYQPLDADLSALAGLATTAFGRSQLTLADAAALRAAAGLGSLATQSASAVAITGGEVGGLSSLRAGAVHLTDFGTLDWGSGYGIGRLTWDTGYAAVTAQSGNALRLGTAGHGQAIVVDPAGDVAFAGAPTRGGIEIGFRDLPRVTAGLERGKVLAAGADVTVAAGATAGAAYRVYNDSGGAIALTPGSGLTLRLAGSAATGARTLAQRGMARIWFNSGSEAIVSGSGVA